MAYATDKRIDQLDIATTLDGTEIIPLWQASKTAFTTLQDVIDLTVNTFSYDATIDFTVNVNPNTIGTTFSPNTPYLTTKIYVSTIDGSQWTWNGTTYVLYIAPFWSKTGNTGTTPGTHFIGTTDNKDIYFKRNNIYVGKIGGTSIGFGTECFNSGVMSSFHNTGMGWRSFYVNTTGTNNSGFGAETFQALTTGIGNTAIGQGALFSLLDGDSNCGLGSQSLGATTTGNNNVGVGYGAGLYNTTASDQIFINSLNRNNYTGDQTKSPIYIQQNATVSSQLIRLNGKVGINVSPTFSLDIVGNIRVGVGGNYLTDGLLLTDSASGQVVLGDVTGTGNSTYINILDSVSIIEYRADSGHIFQGDYAIFGGNTTIPNTCAALEVNSTIGGFLLPRMTKADRNAIASPVAGLSIYQTDNTPGLRVYNGTNWIRYTETID